MSIQDPILDRIATADGLSPNGVRPSAGTVLTTRLDIFLPTCLYFPKTSCKIFQTIRWRRPKWPSRSHEILRHLKCWLGQNAWWRHKMKTFSALLAICVGNSPVTDEFPHKGQWRGALMFSLICTWKKRLRKQSWGWWFETPSRSLWCHCNGLNRCCWFKYIPLGLLQF